MSLLDDVTVLCEGVANGPDVRLLETARQTLRSTLPLADRIGFKAAGSKIVLESSIQAYRGLRATPLVFAIRDRDFLRRELIEAQRAAAVERAPEAARAWPLSRHSIESYLLEPAFLAAATGAEVETELVEFARERRWLDLARATLEDAGYRLRGTRRVKFGDEMPGDLDAAVRLVYESLVTWGTQAQAALDPAQAEALLAAFDRDFRDDGPEWTRVDGKELLRRVEERLRQGPLPGGELRNLLLRHAEQHEPPTALVDDLRAFVERIVSAMAAA